MENKIRHLALIPDGNRRWATGNGLKPWEGHEAGARKLADFLHWAFLDFDIPIVTVYALSTENLIRRTREEISHLIEVYNKYFNKLLDSDLVNVHKVGVRILGAVETLPRPLVDLLESIIKSTKQNTGKLINFMMPYGGRYEILHATRKIAEDVLAGKISPSSIDEPTFEDYLFTRGLPDPDVIIRTGEKRLSNFLLWQTAYSEVYFFDKYWPEFEREDLEFVVQDYPKRQRRFGR